MYFEGFRLHFTHEHGDFPVHPFRKGTSAFAWAKYRTTATLFAPAPNNPAAEIVVAQGTAHCAAGDTFDRELGRQVALLRLLRALPDGSQVGGALLRAYLDRPQALPWALDQRGRLALAELQMARQFRGVLRRRARAAARVPPRG